MDALKCTLGEFSVPRDSLSHVEYILLLSCAVSAFYILSSHRVDLVLRVILVFSVILVSSVNLVFGVNRVPRDSQVL